VTLLQHGLLLLVVFVYEELSAQHITA